MRIRAKKSMNITKSFYCDSCYRNKKDDRGRHYCEFYGDWLDTDGPRTIKCEECVLQLLTAIRAERKS